MEYRNIWYQEEGGLVKELCEAGKSLRSTKQLCGRKNGVWFLLEQADQATAPVVTQEGCCACDDAKFELSFTGIWSPQTHPKDFPTSK